MEYRRLVAEDVKGYRGSTFWILLKTRRGDLRRGVLRHPVKVARTEIDHGERGALHSM